jgi:hypothetical protein
MPAASHSPTVAKPTRGNATGLRKPEARSRVTNGRDILAGIIDQRSQVARRYRDLVAEVCSDMGGADRMSEAKKQLARRFAALSVQAEALETRLANGEDINVSEYSQLTSTLVRVVSRLGINRVAKDVTPTLSEYLAGLNEEADA